MRTIYSFGYKLNGEDQFATTGPNAPLIIDCRDLYNPHNSPGLRKLNGTDRAVQIAVERSEGALGLIRRAIDHLQSNPDGTVAFGCSYGKHRSVALAELTADWVPDAVVIHTGAISQGEKVR